MRITSMVSSITTLLVLAGFVVAMSMAEGLAGLGLFFLILFASIPLMAISIVSLIFAFLKTENLRLNVAARVLSVISAVFCVPLGLIGVSAFVAVATASSWNG